MIINKTWNKIRLLTIEQETLCFFEECQSEDIASIEIDMCSDRSVPGHPDSIYLTGKPKNLPDYQEGIYYIVTNVVKSALPNRIDLLVAASNASITAHIRVSI